MPTGKPEDVVSNLNTMTYLTHYKHYMLLLSFVVMLSSCAETTTMEVTATAYNSLEYQTKKGDAVTAAWGDKLQPGMKAIAVSRDLIEQGLEHGTEVEIEGLKGTYTVIDKMNKRWTNKIDIYMGTDVQAAREWGKQTVNITFEAD